MELDTTNNSPFRIPLKVPGKGFETIEVLATLRPHTQTALNPQGPHLTNGILWNLEGMTSGVHIEHQGSLEQAIHAFGEALAEKLGWVPPETVPTPIESNIPVEDIGRLTSALEEAYPLPEGKNHYFHLSRDCLTPTLALFHEGLEKRLPLQKANLKLSTVTFLEVVVEKLANL